jgi:hypothetical protein
MVKKIFQHLRKQISVYTKMSHSKQTSAIEKPNPKSKTDNAANLSMPMAFDFTAYFDDNALENSTEDVFHEDPTIETTTGIFV